MTKKAVAALPSAMPERGTHRELLVAVAIVLGLIGSLVLMLDPGGRSRDLRDARRLSDSQDVLAAIVKVDAESGSAFTGTASAPLLFFPNGSVQVIVGDDSGIDCSDPSRAPRCGSLPMDTSGHHTRCVANLSGLVPSQLVQLPVDPAGESRSLAAAGILLGARNTGYFVRRLSGGGIEVGPCQAEGVGPIAVRKQ